MLAARSAQIVLSDEQSSDNGRLQIIFFDAGIYKVSSTITIPTGTQMIGEAWSTIMGFGPNFAHAANPRVVVRVGDGVSTGRTEITDMLFTTQGPAAGAIVVEWNVHDPPGEQAVAGAWDTVIRIGGGKHPVTRVVCTEAYIVQHAAPTSRTLSVRRAATAPLLALRRSWACT